MHVMLKPVPVAILKDLPLRRLDHTLEVVSTEKYFYTDMIEDTLYYVWQMNTPVLANIFGIQTQSRYYFCTFVCDDEYYVTASPIYGADGLDMVPELMAGGISLLKALQIIVL